MKYHTKKTIYEGYEVDNAYLPTVSRFILCTDTEDEIMEWVDAAPKREYRNILHQFTIRSSVEDN